jgi:hypothetical protein
MTAALPAGIIVVRQPFPELSAWCTAFLDRIPWGRFYDAPSGKTYDAFDVAAKEMRNPVHYFRGEDSGWGIS